MVRRLILVCLVALSSAASVDRLVQVQVVHRHGDRTPILPYPNDPYNDKLYAQNGPGQLTNVGKQRSYRLGQWLRQRYNGFISAAYNYTELSVISDDTDRVLMSAESELAGLFPPSGNQVWNADIAWQPIPVHINISVLEGEPVDCPRFDTLFDEVYQSPLYQTIQSLSTDALEQIAQGSGENITSLYDAFMIRDTLYIEATLGWKLPEWTDGLYPEPINKIGALFYYALSYNDEITQLTTGPLFQAILDNIDSASQKLLIYSAHDTNVASIVNYLQRSYGPFCPEFSSAVVIEVWEKASKKYVKVFLKRLDDVQQIKIDGCGLSCNVSKLKTLLNKVLVTLDGRDALC